MPQSFASVSGADPHITMYLLRKYCSFCDGVLSTINMEEAAAIECCTVDVDTKYFSAQVVLLPRSIEDMTPLAQEQDGMLFSYCASSVRSETQIKEYCTKMNAQKFLFEDCKLKVVVYFSVSSITVVIF
jgi:hypothetical protein